MTEQIDGDGVIILGMHRSGTSALTRVVSLLGYDLGSDLIGSGKDNPTGFWEDKNVIFINDLILEKLGTPWWDYRPFKSNDWECSEAFSCEKEFIRSLVVNKVKKGIPFLIKDPRMCRTLPVWKAVFAELNLKIQYIEVFRDPFSVARSLERRGCIEGFGRGLDIETGIRLWLRYVVEARMHTQGLVVLRLLFPDMLFNRNMLLETVADFLSCSVLSDLVFEEIDSFLDVNCVHQNSKDCEGYNHLDACIWSFWNSVKREIETGEVFDFFGKTEEILSVSDEFYAPFLNSLTLGCGTRKTESVINSLLILLEEDKKRYARLKKSHQNLEDTISALRESLSWKVTIPLRKALSLFLSSQRKGSQLNSSVEDSSVLSTTGHSVILEEGDSSTFVEPVHCPRIAYIGGSRETFRYRCEFQADMLRHRGFEVEVFWAGNVDYTKLLGSFSHVVFNCVEISDEVSVFCRNAEKYRLKLYYDFEGIEFSETESSRITLSEDLFVGIKSVTKNMHRFVGSCDALIASADGSVNWLKRFFPEKQIFLSRNMIGFSVRDLCSVLWERPRSSGEGIILGLFLGGIDSVDEYNICESALLKLLIKYPNLQLMIFGEAELPSSFEEVEEQVNYLTSANYVTDPTVFCSIDITLLPIDSSCPISLYRAETKYMESGIMAVPVVASDLGEYYNFIQDLKTGVICKHEGEWFSVLEELVFDENKRKSIGENAKFDVLSRYVFDSPIFDDSPLVGEFSEISK